MASSRRVSGPPGVGSNASRERSVNAAASAHARSSILHKFRDSVMYGKTPHALLPRVSPHRIATFFGPGGTCNVIGCGKLSGYVQRLDTLRCFGAGQHFLYRALRW